MPAHIYDHKRQEQSKDEGFLQSEIDACRLEGEALERDCEELQPEMHLIGEIGCNLQSFRAIGKLNASQQAEMTDAAARAKNLNATVGPKLKSYVARAKAHRKRQEALVSAMRKRIEFDDTKRDKTMQDFAGLLAFGLATNQLGDDWAFAAKLVSDYRSETNSEAKGEVFGIFSAVLKGIKFHGQH